jgi:nucleotide-binding universal stress UspA family protein
MPEQPKPSRILVCLSTAPRAGNLAGEAAALARLYGAELHIVHAGADSPEARKRLKEILAEVGWEGDAPMTLRAGRPDEVVREVASTMDADLVVAGALEKEGFAKEIFGSTARRLARRVHCPILLFTEPVVTGTPYQRIAVSTHTDQPTADAITFTLELAKRARTLELHVLHEKDYYDRLAGKFAASEGQRRLATRPSLELTTFLESFDFGQTEVKLAELEEGEGLASVAYGKRHRIDLLVYPAPSRPLTFWDRFFNHPLELVLGNLPNALLIHRVKSAPREDI